MAALQCEICGGKLVGKPGGLFECEYCGMEYNTDWAKAKIQEIKGTVKVEGTVQVQGTVAVDTKANRENLLKRIGICAKDCDFKKTIALADELLKMDPECGEAYLWQVAANYKCTEIAELYRQLPEDLKKIRESAGWKNAMQYLEEGQAAATKQQMEQAQQYWEKPDPALKKRFDLVQPVQDRIFSVSGALLGLRADGTVQVSHTPRADWVAPVAQWTGVKKLFVSSIYDYILALCWDGRVLGISNDQSGRKIVNEVTAWADNEEMIVDMVADDRIVAALFDDGELCCTENHYDAAGTYCFGYACDWEAVEKITIVRRTVENLTGTFYGKSVFPRLDTIMFLGLTRDGRVRCSAACCNLHDVHRLDVALGVPRWEAMEGVAKIGTDGKDILYRDGTIGLNEKDKKWLDFGLSDTGRIMDHFITYRRTFCERNLISVAGDFALRADGTILPAKQVRQAPYVVELGITEWKNIVMLQEVYIGRDHHGMLGLQEDGRVRLAWAGEAAEGISVDDWKLFDSLDTFEAEQKKAQQCTLQEAEEQRKKQEEEKRRKQEEAQRKQEHERKKRLDAQKIAQERRNAGLCQYCGGELKGFFTKKCVSCGKSKDY